MIEQTKLLQTEVTDNIEIAIRCRRIWKNSAICWMVLDYIINIVAFASSIAAIVVEVLIPINTIWIIAFSTLTASLTFIGFTINPKHKMRTYRKAFDQINVTLIRYFEEGSNSSIHKDVADAIIKGEIIIDSTYDID